MKKKTENSLTKPKIILPTPADLAEYCSYGKYKRPKHIEYINNIMVKAAKRELQRIMVNMPPRHGKSEFISKYFPFWYLGNYPNHRIILTSYEARFASSWGRKVKELIQEYGNDLFGIELNPNAKSASMFDLKGFSGGMQTAGAGGPLTGKGADILIIDDPVKNDKQANSPVIRENVWEWFRSTAFTRLEPDGVIIIVMTRWNEDDLCGRLEKSSEMFELEVDENKWEIVKFPAIADEADTLGREPGEPLWKERFPEKKLFQIKSMMGEYWFAAMYQQTPNPLSGGIFKRKNFRYFIEDEYYYYLKNPENEEDPIFSFPKSECFKNTAIDLAITKGQFSDYTVALTFAVTSKGHILVLDVYRDKIEGADHKNMVKSIYTKWKPGTIGIEKVQYQATLIQELGREGLPVIGLDPDRDKISRALLASARMEDGYIYFLENAHWLEKFEHELLLFPNGKHDDQVDALSYSVQMNLKSGNSMPVGVGRRFSREFKGFY